MKWQEEFDKKFVMKSGGIADFIDGKSLMADHIKSFIELLLKEQKEEIAAMVEREKYDHENYCPEMGTSSNRCECGSGEHNATLDEIVSVIRMGAAKNTVNHAYSS